MDDDIVDIRDTFSPPDIAGPDPSDWYMKELQSSINELKGEYLFGHEMELINAIADLTGLLERTIKPF